MRAVSRRPHVLGLHPASGGFGWVLFEEPHSLLDWGTADIRGDKNTVALRRIASLLDTHRPGVLAMERHEERGSRRSRRICLLYIAVIDCAEKREIAVHRFSRAQISQCHHLKGARTRAEIAAAVAACLRVLRPRLPKPRRIWVGEHAAMPLFSAAACALTYFEAQRNST